MNKDIGAKVRVINARVRYNFFLLILLAGLFFVSEPFQDMFNHFAIPLDYLYISAILITLVLAILSYRHIEKTEITVYEKGISGYTAYGKKPNFVCWDDMKKFYVSQDKHNKAIYIYVNDTPLIYINFLVFDAELIYKTIESVVGKEHPILDGIRAFVK